jgi:Cadherin-like domain/Bacterial Ig domain
MSDLNLSSVSGKAILAATFSRGAYDSKTPFVPPAGFELLEVKLANPQSPDFAASAYVNPKTGELVVAYRGSDSTADLSTALKGAASGTWSGQFTDAAAYMKQAQGMAAKVVKDYGDAEDISLSERPSITTLTTGHSLGGMLAQVVAKMYGVEAQVQDAPGAARLIDTSQFKQAALENGQPESGHDITGKVQNVTTSNIAKLGEQFQETQVVAIPALGQMGGLDALATVGAFLANPVAGLATGEALQTVAEHSSVKIEDALHILAGIKSQVADAGALSLQSMYLDRDGKPVAYAPANQGDSSNSPSQIQALVDKSGKVVAFFDREVVDGDMQPVAVVVGTGNRIHLTHAQDGSSPQVIETTVSGERRVVSQTELLTSLQDARGTPEINIYSADAVNGMDLQSDQTHKANEGATQTKTDDAADQTVDSDNDPSNATQQVTDAFSQADKTATDIKTQYPHAVQVADISGALPDTSAHTNANTFSNFLDAQGSNLSPAQQTALANQIDKLGLGGEGDLSFYSLPGGGALIANADGDIVGEMVHSSSGDLQLKATGIDADGNTVDVNTHIGEQGQTLNEGQYNAQVQQQATAMFNSLMAVNNWDHLNDVGKLSALVNLYNATDKLGEAFGATGDNLPGDLGAAAGYLQLAQGIQSGDNLVIANGINVISDGALDSAMNQAFGTTAAGEVVPYLSYALAIRNFADNPEQAMLTGAGTYVGEALGAAFGGPIGAAIGGAIGGMIGGSIGGALGLDDDEPPPPEGAVHFSWDASGHIQHTIDFNQSGGGDAANQVAASVQTMLQNLVDTHNAQNASTADDIAINPYLLPRMGFSGSSAWMEVVLPDGTTVREGINQEGFAQRLLDVLQDNGAIAPAWQVQTQHMHYQQALQAGHSQEQAEAPLRLGAGGQAYAGDEAFSLQGNAVESGDFKTQTFGALVVHLNDNPHVQTTQTQLMQVLRDVEGDGYFEQTQAVAERDSAGNLQAVLILDFNGDGVIQTRDILNLGGNTGATEGASQPGNPTDEARLANTHADQQRNNVQWLDANGDGVLDKSDPAFAAIRLWVDVNQDGVQEGNEASNLASQNISSINFKTGQVTYEDGHTDALTAQTLKADTEGVKFTQINEVNPDGTLHTLDAGTVLEHEGYQGKVQITDEGGTRWADKREQTYEQQAKRTGDWEGTAEQDAHRHGGGNVEGAPTKTTATGSTDFGPVKTQANQTTQSTVTVNDARVVSDAPTQTPPASANVQTNAQTTIAAGDSRIRSNAPVANITNTNSPPRPTTDTRVVFVPISQATLQNEIQTVTNSMIESAQSSLFGVSGLGVLTAVSMGVTVSAAEAATYATEAAQRPVNNVSTSNTLNTSNTFSTTPSSVSTDISTDTSTSSVTFKQVDLGVFNVSQGVQTSTPTSSSQSSVTPFTISASTEPPRNTFVYATVMVNVTQEASTQAATAFANASAAPATSALAANNAMPSIAAATNVLSLDYPQVQAETLPGTEDVVLRLTQSVLLANDSTVNACADPNAPALTITAVSQPLHGQVSLVNGEVLFAPDLNFHGTASFTYTVTDQYGLSTNSSATLQIAAVNDAPVTQGESVSSDEDIGLIFTQAQLLANDSDVDVVTDGQVLSISRVGQAEHGTVWLDAQGDLRFVPDANYHGPAQFTYWVSDGLAANGAGAETSATVSLTILGVNDVPVVTGETVNTNEDTTLLFNPLTLLTNDTDVDVATDGQVLSITAVSNARHGTVVFVTQPDGSQRIAFTPEVNYFGVASYQYTVSDGAGGNTIGTVVVNLAQVNDTPVAADDILSSTAEDTALHISFASLLGNDTDADSLNSQWGGVDDVLTVSLVGNATHGAVAIVNGEVVFTLDANYHGPASFAYQVSDSSGAVSQALATFSVTAINDAPVAVGETISENEDTTLVISQAALLQNDSDVDVATDSQVLSITAVFNAQHGTVTLNANGTISFMPDANFYGNASFDYAVDDGNGGTAITTATIALANVNDAPVTTGETINSNEDEVLTISASALLQNDSDIDNAHTDLTISRVQSGTGGTVSLNASGNVVFTPTANYNGLATFTYWVKDPGGLESNAVTTTVVLAVINDAPSAEGEIVSGASEDAVFNISASTLLANDHDIDDPDSALSLSWVGNSTGGAVSLDANGNVVFTPTLNFNGNATFQYKVQDEDAAGLESAVVLAVIPVAAVNDAPVAVDDQFTTYKNSTMAIAFNQLTSNDTDVDHDALTVTAVRDHANGHASIVNGQVQFVTNAGYTGAASFDYLTDDAHGGQTWATAIVNVITPPNQYATVTYTGGYGYIVDPNRVGRMDVNFSIFDDGPVDSVQMALTSARLNTWGYTWLSVPNSNYGFFGGGHTDYSLSLAVNAGVFSVTGPSFDLLETTWTLTDDHGLQNIWHWNVYGFNNGSSFNFVTWNEHAGTYAPPLILDLNSDGVHFTSIQNSNVSIDVNHDGINDKIAWAGNDDGVLVWDKDHNHQITDASEVGFQTLKAGAQTDLEGLQALDTNGNSLLDADDAKFAEFAVWQDANGNGVTDAGEFKTLTELGIANINLHSDGQVRDAGTLLANSGSGETDATVMGNATFTRTDGTAGVVADTMLAYEIGHAAPTIINTAVVNTYAQTLVSAPQSIEQPIEVSANATPQVVDTSAADAQTAEIIRQALLFNQICNTAVAIDSTPLGFVPIQPDVQLHDMLVTQQDGSHLLMHSA